MHAAGAALRGSAGHSLAILRRRPGPRAAADAAEEVLHVGLGLAAGVAAGGEARRPLRTPVDDIDLRALLDRAAVIEEVRPAVLVAGVGGFDLHQCRAGLVRRGGAGGGQDDSEDGKQRQAKTNRSAHRVARSDIAKALPIYGEESVKP